QLGKALGLYVTAVYLGLFLGPLLGGFLVENFGWRSIFIFNVPFGIFLYIFIKIKFHGEWKRLEGKFKIVNSLIYSLSIVIFLYGFSTINTNIGKLSLLIGIIGLLSFILNEKRSINPILNLNILRKKASSLSALAMLLMNIANTAMWVLLSLYLEDIIHLNPQFTALIISVEPLMVALISVPVGRLSDRIENRIFTIMGRIITTLGLLILSQLTSKSNLIIPIIGLILMGIGLGLFYPPTIKRFMASVNEKNYGMATGLLSTMTYTGQTMSLGIMLYIFTIYLGNVQITESNFPIFILSLKTAFIVFAILSGFGIIVSIFIDPIHKKNIR
ncbi:MAG: MFS transporter, partial [Methanobacterium sp.]|nr:MFS transporter [Methanobacterium sp.]